MSTHLMTSDEVIRRLDELESACREQSAHDINQDGTICHKRDGVTYEANENIGIEADMNADALRWAARFIRAHRGCA